MPIILYDPFGLGCVKGGPREKLTRSVQQRGELAKPPLPFRPYTILWNRFHAQSDSTLSHGCNCTQYGGLPHI
ncbi:hypothetical protein JTE90_028785 [Oedothorax gibbosus]|uniref:Uncharacterized protein n=1 Tax=Oedothorax gibbosus TaxID=931172 RepID=A0AAV6VVX7_9ARAC|nr:hypothetical protein JTE90_028785 [Oedothorax gibbosus]